MKFKKELMFLLIVFVIALVLRLIFLRFHQVVETDTGYYAYLGRNLLSGKGYFDIEGNLNFLLPPLYPILIGLFYFCIKNLALASKLISVFSGALLVIPVYLLAKKFYNKKIAYLSGILVTIFPPLIYISNIAYSDALYIFFIFLAMYVGWLSIEKKKIIWGIFAGILFGLSYLTRPEGIIGLMIIPLVSLIFLRKWRTKRWLKKLLVLFICFLIIVSPYLGFIYKHTGKVTISYKAGIQFEIRNDFEVYSEEYEKELFELAPNKKRIKIDAYNDALKSKGVFHYLAKKPTWIFKRYVKQFYEESLQLITLFPFIFFIFVSLGLFKDRWDKSRWKKELYLIGFLLIPLLVYPLYTIYLRYIIPALPILIIWMSKGICEIEKNLVKKLVVVGVIIILVLGNFLLVIDPVYGGENDPIEHKEAGLWLKEHDDNPIVLSRKPFVSFYSNGIYIQLPYADYKDIIDYANYRNVDYIVIDERYVGKLRPQLKFLLNKENIPNELDLVYENEGENKILIYKIKTFL